MESYETCNYLVNVFNIIAFCIMNQRVYGLSKQKSYEIIWPALIDFRLILRNVSNLITVNGGFSLNRIYTKLKWAIHVPDDRALM